MRSIAVVLVLVAATACGGGSAARPELQHELHKLVFGPTPAAPGATAYVAGPKGSWSGAAGFADVGAREEMKSDARLRLESVSKLWTATVVVGLAFEGRLRLDDTVERWLPGALPFGGRITVRQLLDHTSGLVDNNDVARTPELWLARIHDASLRARAVRLAAALARDPAHRYPDSLEIEVAGAVGLLSKPGTAYHYSNIGYKIAGRIAERAGAAPLADLYRRIIIEPLGLRSAAYEPSGPIAGPHPTGYLVKPGNVFVAASDWGAGALGAEGGIVASAQDEARFLVALVKGEIVPRPYLKELLTGSAANPTYGLGTGIDETCAGTTYAHNGGGTSWASSVAISADGSRVAVVLLNGRRAEDDVDYAAAVFRLLCAA